MSIGRALAWPFRRILDPRFSGLAKQADTQHLDLAARFEELNRRIADREAMREELEAMRQELAAMRQELVALPAQELAAMRRELAAVAQADMEATRETNELLARTLGDLLAEATATTLALEEVLGRKQRAAPTVPAYEKSAIGGAAANEQIVELPYVYRALANAAPGASVLDIGAAESMLAFSLASMGFQVTAVDFHPYPLSHPHLEAVEADILDWETDRAFDVVVCRSTLEHNGLGAHGDTPQEADSSADERALERMRTLTRPGGLLVLTVPFGDSSDDLSQRRYDRAALDRLLSNWSLEDLTVVRRQDHLTWIPDDLSGGSDGEDARRVALVTARRPSE